MLDITDARYEQISERAVRVSGAVIQRKPTAFKLEGACQVGYKTVFLGGIRDPILIKGIEDFVSDPRYRSPGQSVSSTGSALTLLRPRRPGK